MTASGPKPMFHYMPQFQFDDDAQAFKMLGPSENKVAHDLHLAFIQDVDNKLRSALISMGWTPPQAQSTACVGAERQASEPQRNRTGEVG